MAVVIALGLLAAPRRASAQHHHDEPAVWSTTGTFSASLGLQAAGFDTPLYTGSYQAVVPTLGWTGRGLALFAMLGLYHVEENGRRVYGVGDVMVTGRATLVTRDTLALGVALHASVPTGVQVDGLGMGHVMMMPSLWGSARHGALTLDASAGYSRALVALGGAHHDHGAWPLVDPMAMQELTWGAGASVDLGACVASCVRVGANVLGAQPFGVAMTTPRISAAARLSWGTPRFVTAMEVATGIAGDPFTIRGGVTGSVQF